MCHKKWDIIHLKGVFTNFKVKAGFQGKDVYHIKLLLYTPNAPPPQKKKQSFFCLNNLSVQYGTSSVQYGTSSVH